MKNASASILSIVPFSIRIIRRLSTDCLDGSVTIHQLRILLMANEGHSQKNMACILQVSEAAVSKTIHSLVDRKLLRKRPVADRRSHEVTLTTQGKKILKQVEKHVSDRLKVGISQLTKKQQAELVQGLNHLNTLMHAIKGD